MSADRVDDGLRACIKALDEVVTPSLDGANPLAAEQLKLVSRYLGFLRLRLVDSGERDDFELRHYLALARELAADAARVPDCGAPLAAAIASAEAVGQDGPASAAERRTASERLAAAVSVLTRGVAGKGVDGERRRRVESAILHASRSLFDVHRAWYLPIGFEPDPSRVPSLEEALRAPR